MRILYAYSATIGVVAMLYSCGVANAAIDVTRQEAAAAENLISQCAAQQGKSAINCVAGALDGLANGLQKADIPQKAPSASSATAQAASGLRGAAAKPAALGVLNRARSILSGLAAKSSGEAAQVYSRVSSVMSRALGVINRKG